MASVAEDGLPPPPPPAQWHMTRVGRTDRDRSLRSGWSAIVTAVCSTYAISPALPPPMLGWRCHHLCYADDEIETWRPRPRALSR